jgi:hypothetical protein
MDLLSNQNDPHVIDIACPSSHIHRLIIEKKDDTKDNSYDV